MPAMMKAAVFVEPGRIELADKPIPDVGPNDALIRITTTTICGIHSPSRAVPASRTRPTCLSFTQVTTEVTGSGACGHLHSSTTCGPIPFNTASPTPYRCVLVELLQQTRR